MGEPEQSSPNSVPHDVTVRFIVQYETKWGEYVLLSGDRGLLGAGSAQNGLKMSCRMGDKGLEWETSVVVPDQYECEYHYTVYNEHTGAVVLKECAKHVLKVPASVAGTTIILADNFQTLSNVENIYKSTAFKDVIFGCGSQMANPMKPPAVKGPGLTTVRDYTMLAGKRVYVTGSIDELGPQENTKALALNPVGGCVWSGDVTVPITSFPFTYRYFIADDQQDLPPECLVSNEDGDDRIASISPQHINADHSEVPHMDEAEQQMNSVSVLYLSDGHFRHKKPWRGSGLAIPVFSMRTKDSVGCGDFLDLKKMVDFVSACGMHVLQVLPVNDTQVYHTFWDSYPYSAISVFALHPLYLSLQALLKGKVSATVSEEILAARKKHKGVDMDYTATLADKMRIARMVFDSPQGRIDLQDSSFLSWLRANSVWLLPYSAFCFLRDLFGTADHRQWGIMHQNPTDHIRRITSPSQPFHKEILFLYWLQWNLHEQLLEASIYARARRVVLKGDLPIGVAKCSADTWCYPNLFHMDVSVGSPPDAFDAKGQNWGFPGYNWEEMKKDGYLWWRQRLGHMAQYFSAYRVDHILAFFRIFQIPEKHVTGALGHFRPSRGFSRSGLENMGLWDLDRLCEPHISPHALKDELGEDFDEVVGKYLRTDSSGNLTFKAAFNCERAIEEIPTPPNSPEWLQKKLQKIREVLMKLQSNVILLRDDNDPDTFYPRFNLMKTSSFAQYNSSKHEALRHLHDNYFYHSHEDLWTASARETLPVLMNATDMLMCGEDLGFVPPCVPPVLGELGVIGLRIQRMPGPEAPQGQEFGEPGSYSYWTVAAPSCHDTSTLRGWYEEDEARRERFYFQFLKGKGAVPASCSPEIVRSVLQQHLASPSIFCIMPLQDWLALLPRYYSRPAAEEAINDPTNKRHYWRWRMEPFLETLIDDKELLMTLQNMNLTSGRARPS